MEEQRETSKVRLIDRETLGLKLGGLSERSISRYIRLCKIPKPVRIGHKLLWDEQIIDEWVQQRCPADWDDDTRKDV